MFVMKALYRVGKRFGKTNMAPRTNWEWIKERELELSFLKDQNQQNKSNHIWKMATHERRKDDRNHIFQLLRHGNRKATFTRNNETSYECTYMHTVKTSNSMRIYAPLTYRKWLGRQLCRCKMPIQRESSWRRSWRRRKVQFRLCKSSDEILNAWQSETKKQTGSSLPSNPF